MTTCPYKRRVDDPLCTKCVNRVENLIGRNTSFIVIMKRILLLTTLLLQILHAGECTFLIKLSFSWNPFQLGRAQHRIGTSIYRSKWIHFHHMKKLSSDWRLTCQRTHFISWVSHQFDCKLCAHFLFIEVHIIWQSNIIKCLLPCIVYGWKVNIKCTNNHYTLLLHKFRPSTDLGVWQAVRYF